MNRFLGFVFILLSASFALAQDDGVVFSPQSIVVNPRPGFEVDVFLDRGNGEIPTYQVGDEIRIGVTVSEDAYVYLFNIRPDGQVQQLLPNRYDEAGRNNYLRAGQTRYFPPEGARYTFNAEPPRGLEKVLAVASKNQLDTQQLARFEEDPNFATSNLGEEGFARTLSIVVRPIEQTNWVTDTALLYVGQRPQQAAYGTLEVRSNPSDARVFVDGDFVGYTPLRFGTRPGRHEVRIEREGYATYQESVNLRPGDTLRIDTSLSQVRRTGNVSFNSNPSGAEVYVDGSYVGTTPTSNINLDVGSHEARFVLGGYNEARLSFRVETGSNRTVSASLQPQVGRLIVQANVGGAEVYIDGSRVGSIPSGSGRLSISEVSPGTHELTVVAPGYRTFSTEFRIRAGETSEISVRQERR